MLRRLPNVRPPVFGSAETIPLGVPLSGELQTCPALPRDRSATARRRRLLHFPVQSPGNRAPLRPLVPRDYFLRRAFSWLRHRPSLGPSRARPPPTRCRSVSAAIHCVAVRRDTLLRYRRWVRTRTRFDPPGPRPFPESVASTSINFESFMIESWFCRHNPFRVRVRVPLH